MNRRIYIRDRYSRWGERLAAAATARGWEAALITRVREITRPGYGFIRLHPNPPLLDSDFKVARVMQKHLRMVQDNGQIAAYEDKVFQAQAWARWLPDTWYFTEEDYARQFAHDCDLPLISKAREGASSRNVRLIETRADLEEHIRQAFGAGIETSLYKGATWIQRGYVLLQRFIPHRITYRINAVGRERAAFFRYCYPDRPMAQTGNVAPAYGPEDCPAGLLDFADRFFQDVGTRWCAADILRDGDEWRLLEASLAWPHPSPGDCDNGRFWPGGKRWANMWDVLIDELEAGVWDEKRQAAIRDIPRP